MLAVTGTDGKTTTTMLAADDAAMRRADTVAAVATPMSRSSPRSTPIVDVFVVECSSFRLELDRSSFRPEASVWLNLAPDHQNWHVVDATLRGRQGADVEHTAGPAMSPIGFADDPIVMRNLHAAAGRTCTFGTADADYRLERDQLSARLGAIADRVDDDAATCRTTSPTRWPLRRSSSSPGLAERGGRRRRAGDVRHPAAPHRAGRRVRRRAVVQRLEGHHAARRAHRDPRLHRLVLFAGGRNKGLDLAGLASSTIASKASSRSARPPTLIREAFDRGALSSTPHRCARRSPRPPSSLRRATRCCCRRRVRASTGTPTAAIRRVATTSSGWSHA